MDRLRAALLELGPELDWLEIQEGAAARMASR